MSKTWTKRELMKLPWRNWDDENQMYDKLWMVSSGIKHDSGWMRIALIGVINDEPVHIAAAPDDLHFPNTTEYKKLRMDCFWPSGVMQLWARGFKMKVESTSSADIILIPSNPKGEQ